MSTFLHLSRNTSRPVFNAICEAVTGVRVTEETHRKADELGRARAAAAHDDRRKHCGPLREMIRRGYKFLSSTIPGGFPTAGAYLEHYVKEHHPDVAALETFRRNGLGSFRAGAYAEKLQLNLFGPNGSAKNSTHVQEILRIQSDLDDVIARIPSHLLRRLDGGGRIFMGMKLTSWIIVDGYCAMRCIEGSDGKSTWTGLP